MLYFFYNIGMYSLAKGVAISMDEKGNGLLTSIFMWFVIAFMLIITGAFLHFNGSENLIIIGGFMIAYSSLILLSCLPLGVAIVINKIAPYVVRDYFETEDFLSVKADAKEKIDDYNAMCDYMEHLKQAYYERARVLRSDKQIANSTKIEQGDSNIACMKREIRCDEDDYLRAKASLFEFLFDMLDIEGNDEVLSELVAMYNAMFVATECKSQLLSKILRIVNEFYGRIPFRIKFFAGGMVDQKLGFCKYKGENIETFELVITCDHKRFESESLSIKFENEELKNFILYSAKKLRRQGKCMKPIFLMNEKMMQDILKRDNNSCLLCGESKEKDETLFLELEYVEPENSELTSNVDRIRTVCWKCKRDGANADFDEDRSRI